MSEHATYRIGNAVAVTWRLDDGTWLATFPGFVVTAAAEGDALAGLATEVEGAARRLRVHAVEAAEPADAASTAVFLRARVTDDGDFRGLIVRKSDDKILHECGWALSRRDALRDAEEVAQRKGYRVVEASE